MKCFCLPSKAPSPQPTQLEVSSGRTLGERARAQPGQCLLSALSRLPAGAEHGREPLLSVLQLELCSGTGSASTAAGGDLASER